MRCSTRFKDRGYGISSLAQQYSFILLEVIVSLVILSLTIATFMRSFAVSLGSVKKAEVVTKATFLAHRLLDEYEVEAPELDESEGDFGEAYPGFRWITYVEDVKVDYEDIPLEDVVDEFEGLTKITISVYYDDGRMKPFCACKVTTYLTGLEKFSHESKKENKLY
jgi:type II secretory pathway pseudopilin PulG